MLEADIVRKMVAALNAIPGVYCLRTHGGSFQQKGTPDVLGCAHGHFFAIEAKRTSKEQPSAAQKYALNKFINAGGRVFVSHDPRAKEIIEWIKSL